MRIHNKPYRTHTGTGSACKGGERTTMRTVRTDILVNMLVIFVILVNRYGPHTVMIAILAGTVVVIMTVVVVMLVMILMLVDCGSLDA